MIEFSYVVLQYVHDNAAGECLNIGILLVAPEETLIDCRLERQFGRLSSAFRGFNAVFYRRTLGSLARRVAGMKKDAVAGRRSLFPLEDAGKTIRFLWPDAGLNYRASEVRNGAADSPQDALDLLFERFVASQSPDRRPRSRRDDEAVWKTFQSRLPAEVAARLTPTCVEAGPFTFRFEHTFENGKLHVVEALSFDLLEAESVRDKSLRWMGFAHHLKPYVGTLRFVVDGPKREEVKTAYHAAIQILRSSAEIYEADQSDRLATDLEQLLS